MDGRKPLAGPAVETLTAGERLLLWSFRSWVSGPGHRPMVLREFGRVFPSEEAGVAIRGLDRAIAAIAGHARREIVHHPVCAQQVAPDEQAVIAVFAALQEERVDLAVRHAAWLVRPAGVTPVVTAAAALAHAMIENDLMLPYRPLSGVADDRQPAVVLHH
ncbi:hypothetical protein EDC65_4600 [Stella humosa]|uniref:Uncharacterized protein n=1 Tax=Stella humosa TaxID=94 RepID=A0A3N1KQT5_9PROT|nr:hypothetical protein [Stella humosa]ROP83071.1 hypothetical protein EDC65_4600 [Stella humosa]BBK30153.1 hypothetical protein STHU_07870 [Stella humosa]